MFTCPGQENTDNRCSVGDAKNIFFADTDGKHLPELFIVPTFHEQIDHLGPYNGITIVC